MQNYLKKIPLFLFLVITTLSCSSEEEAAVEDEFFKIEIDGEIVDLTYQSSVDITNDKSVFVSGGLYPDNYTVNVVAAQLLGVGSITGAINPEGYSIYLGTFSGPNRDATFYSDSDDTTGSEIIITRNDTYIEGSFSGTVKETRGSNPSYKYIKGSFKISTD